jgi:Zn-dependent protease
MGHAREVLMQSYPGVLIVSHILIVMAAVILHECAHGVTAWYQGDPSAVLAGRITLNPLKHFDLWGGIATPLFTAFLIGFPVGWAKSVPVDSSCMTKHQYMTVVAAGPLCNFMLAALCTPWAILWPSLGVFAVAVNLTLGLFNLLPIPGFDGYVLLKTWRMKDA